MANRKNADRGYSIRIFFLSAVINRQGTAYFPRKKVAKHHGTEADKKAGINAEYRIEIFE